MRSAAFQGANILSDNLSVTLPEVTDAPEFLEDSTFDTISSISLPKATTVSEFLAGATFKSIGNIPLPEANSAQNS